MASQLLYGVAEQGLMAVRPSRVHEARRTPHTVLLVIRSPASAGFTD